VKNLGVGGRMEFNNKEIEWSGMDGIRLDQDGNLHVIMNPQVLKRTRVLST
jgi:sugar lactone lactonase YvrE